MLVAESLSDEEEQENDRQSKKSLDLQVALEEVWMSRSALREELPQDKEEGWQEG